MLFYLAKYRWELCAGIVITLVGAALALMLPRSTTYLYLPGILVVYALSGGVHGYDSGVYLPSLPVWYLLAAPINIAFYAFITFAVRRLLGLSPR